MVLDTLGGLQKIVSNWQLAGFNRIWHDLLIIRQWLTIFRPPCIQCILRFC